MRSIIAIPARVNSKRLPRKILSDIGGKPMIKHVLDKCMEAKNNADLILCTDDVDLMNLSKEWGYKPIFTNKKCSSGTERIASVLDEIKGEDNLKNILVINVQGDQPFIDPCIIENLIDIFNSSNPNYDILTPVYKLSPESIHNPNIVKVLRSSEGEAIYFSRSALPHVRDVNPHQWYKYCNYWGHVGIYGYRGDILKKWFGLKKSKLENLEKLEQLRFIEAGIKINTFIVKDTTLSIDTREQLDFARSIYKG